MTLVSHLAHVFIQVKYVGAVWTKVHVEHATFVNHFAGHFTYGVVVREICKTKTGRRHNRLGVFNYCIESAGFKFFLLFECFLHGPQSPAGSSNFPNGDKSRARQVSKYGFPYHHELLYVKHCMCVKGKK